MRFIKDYGSYVLVGMALAMIIIAVDLFTHRDECIYSEEKNGWFEYEINGGLGKSYKCETVVNKQYCMIEVNGYAELESEVN